MRKDAFDSAMMRLRRIYIRVWEIHSRELYTGSCDLVQVRIRLMKEIAIASGMFYLFSGSNSGFVISDHQLVENKTSSKGKAKKSRFS